MTPKQGDKVKANAGLSISSTRGLVPGYAGAALVILGFLVPGGCGAFQNQHGGGGPNVLRYNLQTEIPDLNPATTAEVASFAVLNNVMEGLYRLDENNEPRPAMAKSVEVSEDELIHTFTLRDGIKWSNGDPVTSYDFRYAWQAPGVLPIHHPSRCRDAGPGAIPECRGCRTGIMEVPGRKR
jgi:ABC-type transport system substrate-binding protein